MIPTDPSVPPQLEGRGMHLQGLGKVGGELGWPIYLGDSMSSSSPTFWVASSALHLQLISLCLGNRVDVTISSTALFESVKQFADKLIFLGGFCMILQVLGWETTEVWYLRNLKYENLNKFDTSVPHEIQFLSTSHISWNFHPTSPPFQKPGLHLSQICAATLLQRQSVKVCWLYGVKFTEKRW